MPNPDIKVLRPGNTTKPDPVTIVLIANPALEAPWNSGAFIVDPIVANQPAFDSCTQYVRDALFAALPGQRENYLTDPGIQPNIRVVSLFVTGLPAVDANALAAQDGVSNLLIARRGRFSALLTRYGLAADVAYAVSASESHDRASAWFTTDDDGRPGVPFTLDGVSLTHRYYCRIPGTVALPSNSKSLTALHEFGHAFSSYSNGSVVDLYVDSNPAVNIKRGRPIPAQFADYSGTSMASDGARDGLGYPAGWQSYHCELRDPGMPAVMDNYWMAPGGVPEYCLHDRITTQFLRDRILAKISR